MDCEEEYPLPLMEGEKQIAKPHATHMILFVNFCKSWMQKEYNGLKVGEDEMTGKEV
jgi:hypothetical protein